MRFAFALIATTLLACSSPGPDDPDGSGDEAAVVAAAAAPQVIDAVEAAPGSVDWKVGADGRVWRANGRYFGLAGAKPLFDSGADILPITAWTLDGGVATLVLGMAVESLVQVNLTTGAVTALAKDIFVPSTLHNVTITSDAAGVYFMGGPNGDKSARNDLWRVDRGGKLTKIATDLWVIPPGGMCDLLLTHDEASLFAVVACDAGSQIVQVPIAGGSAGVVAGVADHVRSAARVGDSIVYSTDAEISRIPRTGGAKTLSLRASRSIVAGDGTDFVFVDAPAARKLGVNRSKPGGGAPISLGEIPALTDFISPESITPTKDAVFVSVVETPTGSASWKYRLVKLPR